MADTTIPQLQEAAAEDVNDDFVFPVDNGTETYKLKFENLMAYLIANFPADWITEAMVKANAITSSKIANGAVTTAKIGDNQVTTAKIGNNQVTTAKIANGGSNTVLRMSGSTMGWGTLTAAHIAANAIGNSELASNAVMNVNVASNAAISGAKINPDFDNQTVRSTGPFLTGSVNVAVNSSSPSGTLFTPQAGSVYLCTAKYRSGSNTTAVALALISRHSSAGNVYISNLHATTLGFELHPISDDTIRLYSTSGSTTTASVSWLRLH